MSAVVPAESRRGRTVAIVGGGAAGCVTALTLLRGLRHPPEVTIYERAPRVHTTLCGEGIRTATLDLLDTFDSREHVAQRFRGARWAFPGGVSVEVDDPCCTLERASWIPAMAEAAQKSGAGIRLGAKVSAADVPGLRARHDVVIGADGPGSAVRHAVGGTVETCLGLQYRIRGAFHTDRLEFVTDKRWSPEYAWVFPKGEILNVGILADDPQAWPQLDAFASEMGARGDVVKREAYPIGFNGSTVQEGNVLLTGDAAGLTNPVTKGGLAAIIHAARVLRNAFEDHEPLSYGRRMRTHPLRDPLYQRALRILRRRDNRWFERLARHAPRVIRTPGGAANQLLLLKGLAREPQAARELVILYRAMALSRHFSW